MDTRKMKTNSERRDVVRDDIEEWTWRRSRFRYLNLLVDLAIVV